MPTNPADPLEGMAWKNIIRISSENDREFARYVLAARSDFLTLALRKEEAVKRIYLESADRVAEELKAVLPTTPGRALRARHLQALEKSLRAEAERIRRALEVHVKDGVERAVELGADPFIKQLGRCMEDAGLKFSWLKLQRGFGEVNRHAVETFWARTRGGIFLSDRIWLESEKARRAIAAVVQDGIARGLDAVKVAREVEQYLKVRTPVTEFRKMMARMGPGRIPKNLSYEALRMARTEIAIAHMEGVYAAGKVTPGYLGVVWCLSASHPLRDECDDLAEADLYGMGPGVYPAGEEPIVPHPNCLCFVVPKVEPPEKFVPRLREWARNPGRDPALDKWYNDISGTLLGRAVAVALPPPAAQAAPAPPPPGSQQNPIHVDDWRSVGRGASRPHVGRVGGRKYLFKANVVALPWVNRPNLEAELLASKVLARVGLKAPATDFAWFEAGGRVAQYLRTEWVERAINAYDFRTDPALFARLKVEPFMRMQLADILIGNTDRHEGNFLFLPDGEVVPIDHNLAFVSELVYNGGFVPAFRDDMVDADQIVRQVVGLNAIGSAIVTSRGINAYKSLISDIQARLADADIRDMVLALPGELAEPARKAELERILIWRRDHLWDLLSATGLNP